MVPFGVTTKAKTTGPTPPVMAKVPVAGSVWDPSEPAPETRHGNVLPLLSVKVQSVGGGDCFRRPQSRRDLEAIHPDPILTVPVPFRGGC